MLNKRDAVNQSCVPFISFQCENDAKSGNHFRNQVGGAGRQTAD